MAQGRCLCGALTYELEGPFSAMIHCHCSMCRKHHGTGFATFVAGPIAGFRWISGKDRLGRHTDSHFKCDTKSLVGVVPTVKEGTTRVTG